MPSALLRIRPARLQAACRLAFWVSAAAIAWLSLDASPPLPAELSDKLMHLGAYAWLGTLAVPAYGARLGRPALWLGLALYGGALELGQLAVATRSAELMDGVADAAGALAGILAGAILLARWRRAREGRQGAES